MALDIEKSTAFANRLRDLWLMMNESMSQGHNHSIKVNSEMVDDIRSAETLLRMFIKKNSN